MNIWKRLKRFKKRIIINAGVIENAIIDVAELISNNTKKLHINYQIFQAEKAIDKQYVRLGKDIYDLNDYDYQGILNNNEIEGICLNIQNEYKKIGDLYNKKKELFEDILDMNISRLKREMKKSKITLEWVDISGTSPLIGKKIKDISLSSDIMVMAIFKKEGLYLKNESYINSFISEGDKILFAGSIDEILRFFHKKC
ncbi:MAG: TrkA C-terminal domain-containing protein [Nitrospirota bacterium]